jgi:uncharacterized phiE125 gp8 family phage protein
VGSILWSLPSLGAGRQIYQGWAAQLVTPPKVEPVSIAEAKLQCRISIDDDDDALLGYTIAAREHCEKVCGRAFITQEWDFWLPGWPATNRIRIPFAPLQSVEYLQYTDSSETANVVDPSIYVVQPGTTPGELVLRFAQIWPPTVMSPSWPINVRFKAGYSDDASKVPQSIKQAILMLTAHWYENREAVVVGRTAQIAVEIMFAVDALLANYRVSPHGFSQARTYDLTGSGW